MPTARVIITHSDYFATCRKCQHIGRVDLDFLIRTGQGDIRLNDLRLRCTKCGGTTADRAVCSRGWPRDRDQEQQMVDPT